MCLLGLWTSRGLFYAIVGYIQVTTAVNWRRDCRCQRTVTVTSVVIFVITAVKSVQPDLLLAGGAWAIHVGLGYDASIARASSSVRTATPRLSALVSFEPAASPATR
jgi:hypothetical protein